MTVAQLQRILNKYPTYYEVGAGSLMQGAASAKWIEQDDVNKTITIWNETEEDVLEELGRIESPI